MQTRLPAALGAESAAAFYRCMGHRVVEQCAAAGRHRTVIWYAPAGGEAAVRSWLGGLQIDGFFCQPDGELDARANWFGTPLLNPAGLARGIRENAAGLDLNSDAEDLQ